MTTEPSLFRSSDEDPNFGVILEFLVRFGVDILGDSWLLRIDILEDALESESDSPYLSELLVKLLRKLRKSISLDKWEKCLLRFLGGSEDGIALREAKGFKYLSPKIKTRILRGLCEAQFELNLKFRLFIGKFKDKSELRSSPLGTDSRGNDYYYFTDSQGALRIYKEDPDEETWELVARNKESFTRLLLKLKDKESVTPEEERSLQDGLENIIRDTRPIPNSIEHSNATSVANSDEEASNPTPLTFPSFQKKGKMEENVKKAMSPDKKEDADITKPKEEAVKKEDHRSESELASLDVDMKSDEGSKVAMPLKLENRERDPSMTKSIIKAAPTLDTNELQVKKYTEMNKIDSAAMEIDGPPQTKRLETPTSVSSPCSVTSDKKETVLPHKAKDGTSIGTSQSEDTKSVMANEISKDRTPGTKYGTVEPTTNQDSFPQGKHCEEKMNSKDSSREPELEPSKNTERNTQLTSAVSVERQNIKNPLNSSISTEEAQPIKTDKSSSSDNASNVKTSVNDESEYVSVNNKLPKKVFTKSTSNINNSTTQSKPEKDKSSFPAIESSPDKSIKKDDQCPNSHISDGQVEKNSSDSSEDVINKPKDLKSSECKSITSPTGLPNNKPISLQPNPKNPKTYQQSVSRSEVKNNAPCIESKAILETTFKKVISVPEQQQQPRIVPVDCSLGDGSSTKRSLNIGGDDSAAKTEKPIAPSIKQSSQGNKSSSFDIISVLGKTSPKGIKSSEKSFSESDPSLTPKDFKAFSSSPAIDNSVSISGNAEEGDGKRVLSEKESSVSVSDKTSPSITKEKGNSLSNDHKGPTQKSLSNARDPSNTTKNLTKSNNDSNKGRSLHHSSNLSTNKPSPERPPIEKDSLTGKSETESMTPPGSIVSLTETKVCSVEEKIRTLPSVETKSTLVPSEKSKNTVSTVKPVCTAASSDITKDDIKKPSVEPKSSLPSIKSKTIVSLAEPKTIPSSLTTKENTASSIGPKITTAPVNQEKAPCSQDTKDNMTSPIEIKNASEPKTSVTSADIKSTESSCEPKGITALPSMDPKTSLPSTVPTKRVSSPVENLDTTTASPLKAAMPLKKRCLTPTEGLEGAPKKPKMDSPIVGEAVEEAVVVIRGDGEGALNDAKNNGKEVNGGCSSNNNNNNGEGGGQKGVKKGKKDPPGSPPAPLRQSRRSSGRIASLRIKEAERRQREEEEALLEFKAHQKKKKQQKDVVPKSSKKKQESDYEFEEEEEEIVGGKQKKRKRKKKKKKRGEQNLKEFEKYSSGSDDSEDEENVEEEDDYCVGERIAPVEEEDDLLFKSDHEFSCESDVPEEEATPIQHARTLVKKKQKRGKRRKAAAAPVQSSSSSSEEEEDDFACRKCGKADHPEWILLCDSEACEAGWHASCLRPSLMVIPEGAWICPDCHHRRLIEKLETRFSAYEVVLKKREADEKRKERLAFVSLSLSKVLPSSSSNKVKKVKKPAHSPSSSGGEEDSSGSSSASSEPSQRRRAARNVNYNMKEYDDMIKSALKDEEGKRGGGPPPAAISAGKEPRYSNYEEEEEDEEDQEPQTLEDTRPGVGKGKDMSNILLADSEGGPQPIKMEINLSVSNKRKTKKKKLLSDLAASSEDEDDDGDSGSDFHLSGDGSDEDPDEDFEADDSSDEGRRGRKGGKKSSKGGFGSSNHPTRRSNRNRKVLYDDDFIFDGSLSEDEDGVRKPANNKKKKKKKKGKGKQRVEEDSWTETEESEDYEDYGKKRMNSASNSKNKSNTVNKKRGGTDESEDESEENDFDERAQKYRDKIINSKRRTRGKKISFQETLSDASSSSNEGGKRGRSNDAVTIPFSSKQPKNEDSDNEDEYDENKLVVDESKSEEEEEDDEEESEESEESDSK